MATDLERLVVQLEASTVKYERAMQRALGQTNRTARSIESRFQRMSGVVGTSFGQAFALVGGATALRGAQQLIDASTRIENALKVAGLAGEELTRVYDDLFASAQRNAAPLESLVTLYGRAAIVQNELGVSTQELLRFTDNVAVALRVAGTDAQSASGALLQLSQALGSGTVRAEEFNSILEGALPIAQAAAAGLKEAGGSVAELRSLVIDGKVSSEAFFRAFEAGSVILQQKVANSELTVSQGFVRLQNVLIDTAGKFDDATGASSAAAEGLNSLALAVEQLGNFMADNQGAIASFIGVLEGDYLDAIRQFREDIGLADIVDPLIGAAGDAKQSAAEIEASIRGVITAASGVADTEAIDGLIDKLATGDLTAQELQQALIELGGTSINFAVVHDLAGLIGQLRTARAEAQALAVDIATPQGPQGRGGKRGTTPTTSAPGVATVSLGDYPIGGGGSGGSGGGGKSPTERFAEALEQQRREIENLREKTALQASLNPLVNDYGFAIEKLRVQQELENEAAEAGLTLTPERVKAIEQLAEGYARVSVEAEQLAEAQEYAQQTMADFSDLAKSSLRGFIDDLREGKDASEALGNALGRIGDKLLDMSLNLLFGGGPGGFNILSLFGFAKGGIAKNGKPMKTFARGGVSHEAAIFGEGPMAEAAVPLPDGRRIPVELRMPALGAAGGKTALTVHIVSDDEKFSAYVTDKAGTVVAQAAPAIIAASTSQSAKNTPAALAQYQHQRVGSDFRVG